MAPVPSWKARPFANRTRNNLIAEASSNPAQITANESVKPLPKKKHRYVPGGPGGGGRWVDENGVTVAVGGSGPGGNIHAGARRVARPPIPASNMARPRPQRARSQRSSKRGSAADRRAAVEHDDGYKPREERSLEEFHPDLDIHQKLQVFSSDEVDGITTSMNGTSLQDGNGIMSGAAADDDTAQTPSQEAEGQNAEQQAIVETEATIQRKRRGRPARRPGSMLQGLGTTTTELPKRVPPPGHDPREKLSLPKPVFRKSDPFAKYEQEKGVGQQNYVDRAMSNAGYQESDKFHRPKALIRWEPDTHEGNVNKQGEQVIGGPGIWRVEYDMDLDDFYWLEYENELRKKDGIEPIKPHVFEMVITKIEIEWHDLEKRIPKPTPKPPQTHRPRSSSAVAVNGEAIGAGEEQDSRCAVCDDGDCENANAIVFCDGCDLAVHQECYGVPLIPEGQWMCRKCQLIGRHALPTCIFCPNMEGAFKQTNNFKWAHVLCAIWIPEVSLGNPSLMEPVTDVERIPNNRWRTIVCYICNQKMGAPIQCSNKHCFVAFHVTCARRAQLGMQMKTGHGASITTDPKQLRAFCDKHTDDVWRQEHNTDEAFAEAQKYYQRTMRGKRWADSQASALAEGEPQASASVNTLQDKKQSSSTQRLVLTHEGNKRKGSTPQRPLDKTEFGAPLIPAVILRTVVALLGRLGVHQKQHFAEQMVKYWSLKMEVRNNAPLIKRFQPQSEMFSSMDMTRRNWSELGAPGAAGKERRIAFGEILEEELGKLKELAGKTKERERLKRDEAYMQKDIVDAVYYPIGPLLGPILEKAQSLDKKKVFQEGFESIQTWIQERGPPSVYQFSLAMAAALGEEIGLEDISMNDLQMHLSGRASNQELSADQKEKRKLMKRIVNAVIPALKDATLMESELSGKPSETALKKLDEMRDSKGPSPRASPADFRDDSRIGGEASSNAMLRSGIKKSSTIRSEDEDPMDVDPAPGAENVHLSEQQQELDETKIFSLNELADKPGDLTSGIKKDYTDSSSHAASQKVASHGSPVSMSQARPPSSHGGIAWYMKTFDPVGTTVHEERWNGREALRDMSEELSEMDEDELKDLADGDLDEDTLEHPNRPSLFAASGDRFPDDIFQFGAGSGQPSGGFQFTAGGSGQPSSGAKTKSGKPVRRWKGFK